MMPAPAPYHPFPPPPARSSERDERNAAAIASLVCAILWPLCISCALLWNATTHFAHVPDWFGTLFASTLIILPPLGLITAVVGLVRSFTRPLLYRTRWQAIVGLIFALMWLGYTLMWLGYALVP